VDDALDGEAEDGLVRADGVAAGHSPPGLRHGLGRGLEDGGHRLPGQGLREGGQVQGHRHPRPHGEHVGAGVGRRHRAEVGGVVDQRGEEVGGGHERDVVGDPVDGGIVERGQPDEEVGVAAAGEVVDQAAQGGGAPLGGAAPTVGPLGETDRLGHGVEGYGVNCM
jgi:hypothetical protein